MPSGFTSATRTAKSFESGAPAETEPNGDAASATPLTLVGGAARYYGNVLAGDVDLYSFAGASGDRVYMAVQAAFSASGSTDGILELLDTDGITVLEGDEDDGSFGTLSSSIANTPLPADGTYFVRVRHNNATGQLRPYRLYFQLRQGSPVAETESNDTAPGEPLPAGGWVSGATSAGPDVDFYNMSLDAGDTVYLSLDMDPERDGDSNNQLGLGPFDGFQLNVNDGGAGFAPYTAPDSEAFFMTVKDAGNYNIAVSVPITAGGVPGTYTLSATVLPAATPAGTCTTYTATDTPLAIPDSGLVASTITVPGNPRIADLDVAIQATHSFLADLDLQLQSPAGNNNGLLTDVFNNTVGGPTALNAVFDDEAAVPPAFLVGGGMVLQPEFNYRLAWFDGEDAGGVWTLTVRDDFADDVGMLENWSLRICEPPPAPICPDGFIPETVLETDFETDTAGFTHSGTLDEWERGLPATAATATTIPVAAFDSCSSGSNCWKTDLDGTYDSSSSQDLLSAAIDLTGLSPPVTVRWSQRYQMETASNDHYHVTLREITAPANGVRLFEFLDATMANAVGTPTTSIGASAGWGLMEARADVLAGLNTELVFHLDSNASNDFGGAAIDDVSVTACRAASADLSISKDDGVTEAVPGTSITYTIIASNTLGGDAVTGATVADAFPPELACTWTCTGAGGGTCTSAGAGDIADIVDLPVGASVTYIASCDVDASATGSLTNAASIAGSIDDPDGGNNGDSDTDTLTPQADLSISKTDGVGTAIPGEGTTYVIVASNAGPSDVPLATVTDTFPPQLACSWTCAPANGASCGSGTSGAISDGAVLPAGASATYTAICAIAADATGTLVNTASITSSVEDPTNANDSSTDTDTLTPVADLSIAKSDGTNGASPSQTLDYAITVANAGPSDAPGATLTDTLPAGLIDALWACVQAESTTPCPAPPDDAGSGDILTTIDLPVGTSLQFDLSATLDATTGATVVNTAQVDAPAGVTDPVDGNDTASDSTVVLPDGIFGDGFEE